MRVLVVGAGAVGQSYGVRLQRGGAEVGFLVKAKHAPALAEGMRLLDLGVRSRGWVQWKDYSVHTEPEGAWDFVVLAVSSDAIDASWVEPLGRATGDAVMAVMQPGMRDQARVAEVVAQERLVKGLITVIAFHSPLEGDPRLQEPGMVYWFPPLAKSLFQGERARPLVDALRRGGVSSGLHPNLAAVGGYGGGALNTHMAALELSGWTFQGLRRGPWMAVASRAMAEVARLVHAETGAPPPLALSLVNPTTAAMATHVLPPVFPFALEPYLEAHFTKVGAQTRAMLQGYVDAGRARGLGMEAVAQLARSLHATGREPLPDAPT